MAGLKAGKAGRRLSGSGQGGKRGATARAAAKATAGKAGALTGSDLAVAGVFLSGVIVALVAFSTAVHPLNEWFIVKPALVGMAIGAVAAVILHRIKRQESFFFVLAVVAFSMALWAVGVTLALNRPLDRSPIKHHFISVINKYERGSGRNAEYFLEVDGFTEGGVTLRHLQVPEDVHTGVAAGGRVDVLTRNGFFGLTYLEQVQLVGLDLPAVDEQKLPAVPPTIPVDGLPGK
ncbi:MAG TPA: hypothetical protein PK176_14640 [Acidobacteriota bacterium]|nr:hypothetical protein [Acidobacteriota bacterium]HQM64545.1 hypothetical protein [Acidobacteriota bacterium]